MAGTANAAAIRSDSAATIHAKRAGAIRAAAWRRPSPFRPSRRLSILQSEYARLRSPGAASSDPSSTSAQQFTQARRRRGRKRRPIRFALDHLREHVRDRLALERPPAGQHLVEHDAERPDVGAPVDGRPLACSGLMYAAVPRIIPACVTAGVVIVGDLRQRSMPRRSVPSLSPARSPALSPCRPAEA